MDNLNKNLPKTILKALILIVILISGGVVYQYSGYSEYMTKENISFSIEVLRTFVDGFGYFGPLLFILIAALCIAFYIPSTMIICLGVTIFGGVLGILFSTMSIYIAAVLIYAMTQRLGRDFVVSYLSGTKLKKIEKRLHKKGIWAVFYLRLIFFMFPPLNWLMALSNINFRNYFLGTVLGTVHHIIVIAWMTDIIVDIIRKGDSMNPFKTPILLMPLSINVFILFVTWVIDGRLQKKSIE